ncbi:hypothetical protein [Afipia sp. DC4300-2b1]|uniref:hypothetical protein n=1 Tax=Afipia sp. DC4300-2b1 TaxID=2804672 RepID=UPI003CEB3A05
MALVGAFLLGAAMDCTKSVANMTPGEAASCGAGILSQISNTVSQITLGQWAGVVIVIVAVPAMLASWFLPILFFFRCIGRFIQKDTQTA